MTGYAATAEPLPGGCLAVRVHPDPDARAGDPYAAGCVVVPDGPVAVVKLWLGGATFAAGRALDRVLWACGFDRLRYERRRGGRVTTVERVLWGR